MNNQRVAVERTIWIDAPRERAWAAVTQPEHLNRWYAPHYDWEIPSLEVGATVKFHNSDTEILLATIEVVDAPRQFTLRWATKPETVTTFLLEEENGGTRATIRETGYESLPDAEREEWMDSIHEGYGMSMENLKTLLEGENRPD